MNNIFHCIRVVSALLAILFCASAKAQAPHSIPYQAIARNSSGAILANQSIRVRFSVHDSIATGTIVYRETFNPTTNAQGLFVLNVGTGTVVSGAFATINWGHNTKFMQVEMDPSGGTSYVDMGTQQMMSVPYALYSNNGMPNGSAGDMLYNNGSSWVPIAAGSEGQVLTMRGGVPSWNFCITIDTLVRDGGMLQYSGYAQIVISGGIRVVERGICFGTSPHPSLTTGTKILAAMYDETNVSQPFFIVLTGLDQGTTYYYRSYFINADGIITYSPQRTLVTSTFSGPLVGQNYGGGTIAYILQPGDIGYDSTTVHGLVVTPSAIGSASWGCESTTTGASGSGWGTGAVNTATIASACGPGSAAKICEDLVYGGFSDWFLPSQGELTLVPHFMYSGINKYYWTSTEVSSNTARAIYWSAAAADQPSVNKSTVNNIVAIRFF